MAWFRCTGGSGGSLKLRTASGAIASFETNYVAPLNSLKCEINAKQDLHGYDHPWAGGAGKNKLNPDYRDNTSNNIKFYNGVGGGVALQAGQAYTISVPNGSTHPAAIYLQDYSSGTEYTHVYSQRTLTYTPSANCNIKIDIYYANSDMPTEPLSSINVQLEKGSQATSYEPYSNICPIVGHTELNLTRCGVNLFDDAYVDNNLTAEQILPAGTYYIKAFVTGSSEQNRRFSFYFNDTWNVIDNEGTFDNGGITWSGSTFGWLYGNATATVTLTKPYKLRASVLVDTYQVRRYAIYDDNSITTFIPYNGQTFTVAFGQTCYGGVYDKSGRLTITHAVVDLGTLDYAYYGGRFNTTGPIADLGGELSGDYYVNVICDSYVKSAGGENNTFFVYSNKYVYLYNSDYTDAAAFKASLSGVMLAYELATPIVIDVQAISPSAVVGTNNVFGDTGDTEVKYLYKEASE